MARSLDQWVAYIQSLHHREIDLSLERVREVYSRMYPQSLPYKIISLSGTNGKGSTAELLASMYRQAGFRVGKFTSPHLIHFNERFNLDGEPVNEQRLLLAFDRVEMHRANTPITFFEYCTLLAIELFASNQVDVAIMEVGLGGRLDSVNILDADVSIITSISIDHTNWLGSTIEKIAYEKVGIARKDKPLILGMTTPPTNMLAYAEEIGAKVRLIGRDFNYRYTEGSEYWEWSYSNTVFERLPLPYNQTSVQLSNCALALATIQILSTSLPVSKNNVYEGIQNANIFGRCQLISRQPDIIFDVSHNESSVAYLAQFLNTLKKAQFGNNKASDKKQRSARTVAVVGMLRDKEIAASLAQISSHIDEWYVATIHNERGATAAEISTEILLNSTSKVAQYDRVEDAYDAAKATLTTDDCLVVFGSFHTVGDILDYIK